MQSLAVLLRGFSVGTMASSHSHACQVILSNTKLALGVNVRVTDYNLDRSPIYLLPYDRHRLRPNCNPELDKQKKMDGLPFKRF